MVDKSNNPGVDEEARLERHIDEMMDPKLPDPVSAKPGSLPGAPELPEIDIFKDNKKPELEALQTETAEDKDPGGTAEPLPLETDMSAGETPPQEQRPTKKDTADEKIKPSADIDTPADDQAVDDIVAHESDELLAAQDAAVAKAFDVQPSTMRDRLKSFFVTWWQHKVARYITIVVLLALLTTAAVMPTSRYMMLNTVGVRSSASMTVLDSTTSLPLKNVSVTMGGRENRTNADGVVHLSGIRLGPQKMTIRQLGFASISKTVVVGLGSNPLGDISLKAVGLQFKFVVTDYVSGKPVAGAEANAGAAYAQANDKGEIILTVGGANPGSSFSVLLNASGYRQEKVTVDTTNQTPVSVAMVSAKEDFFVSRQSGKYDVYKVDIDGKNKKLLLAGTGLERPQITLAPHPTKNLVALVSSRDDKRNQDGYLMDTLTVINADTGAVLSLDVSDQIKIVDWIGDKLIYVKVKAGTSAGNAERYQLVSYDYSAVKRLQLAAANYFADIVSAKGVLYYATGNNYQPGQSQFVRVNPDNTGRQVLLNSQVWNIVRSGYNDLYLAGDYSGNTQNWYSYHIGDSSVKKLGQAPGGVDGGRFYLDAPDGKQALWTETRDGKGVLLAYDDAIKKDTVLVTQSGLTYPLRWLDDRTAIYHVVTPQETASYVVSLDGGSPHKIADVTNVAGLGQWNPGY